MKRKFSFLSSLVIVAAVALCCLFALPQEAKAATEGDYVYSVSGDEATITGYNGDGGDITIPDTLGGYPVTTIDNNVFKECTGLTSITIPGGVKSIGVGAFGKCTGLKFITIPEGVESIGDCAFKGCTGLTSITIPGSVQSVGLEAFGACTGLKSVTIRDGMKIIDDSLFSFCTGLKSIAIPESVESIGFDAFTACNSLTDVYYSGTEGQWGGITIGSYNAPLLNATVHFATLEAPEAADYAYTVENGEATITGYTGSGGDITILDTLGGYPATAIGEDVFYDCDSLTSVTIGGNVKRIDNGAFRSCDNLTSVAIGANVKHIGDGAFYDCGNLTDVYYNDTESQWRVISIGSDNGPLLNATFHFTAPEVPDDSDYKYTVEDGEATITEYNGDGGDITIPSSLGGYPVTTIGDGAFGGHNKLTGVIIPDSVTSIGDYAFENCARLIDVTIGDNVQSIGEGTFWGCTTLTNVTIGESVTAIGYAVFTECICLTNITIPDSVTTIKKSAFYECRSLTGFWVSGGNANFSSDESGVLFNKDKTTLILAPGGIAGSYTIPDSVTTIDEEAFEGCESLTSVTIGKGVVTIDSSAFFACWALEKVYYAGTQAQWGDIVIGEDNESLLNANIYYNHGPEHSYTDKVIAPTCTAEGYTAYTCTCGDTYKVDYVNALEHSYAAATCTKARTCTKCAATTGNALGHSYDAGKVTKVATCKAAGVKTYTCSTCKGTKAVAIAKLTTHTYTNNCDTACNVCGAKRTITHSYDAGKVTKAATCKAAGVKTYTCKVCKGTKAVAIAKLTTHTYKTTTTKATLTKNGKIVKKCTVCGKVASTTTISYPKTVKLSATSYTYNGKAKTPTVTVKDSAGKTLKKGTDYTVTYASGRKNVGTYKVTVKMIGNYTGTKVLTFKITPVKVAKCTVKLSATSYTYNGKAKTPSVTVKDSAGKTLKKGTDYTVTYASGRKNVGTYKVTVKMKGNYTGTKVLTFKILPKAASINKLTAKSKAIAVKLNRVTTQSTGYQIQYSTSSKFTSAKTVNVTSYKTSTKTISGLKKGKKYYVRVRTYKTVGGTKIYSAWSASKSVKTK